MWRQDSLKCKHGLRRSCSGFVKSHEARSANPTFGPVLVTRVSQKGEFQKGKKRKMMEKEKKAHRPVVFVLVWAYTSSAGMSGCSPWKYYPALQCRRSVEMHVTRLRPQMQFRQVVNHLRLIVERW